jgi:hypothetical protein
VAVIAPPEPAPVRPPWKSARRSGTIRPVLHPARRLSIRAATGNHRLGWAVARASMEHDPLRAAGRTIAVLAAYAVLAVVVLRPTPWELAHTAPAFHGVANDALLLAWAMAHVSRTLFVHPIAPLRRADLPSGALTLAYSDT